ncbi:MAG: restriction endonuclease subunit S [Anaerolineales bacterium]
MNETLESMARALFKAWFVDGAEDDWETGALADEFQLTMGQSPPGGTYNDSGDGLPFYQGRTDFGFRYPSNRIYCSAPTRFAKAGDTLVSVRAPVGDMNMSKERCAIGRGIAAVRHKSGGRSYTYYAMQNLRKSFARFEAEGTIFGSINKKDFESLDVTIPPLERVRQFEEFANPLDQRIESNEQQSTILVALRDALLPKLVSGELRVKNVAGGFEVKDRSPTEEARA